MTAKPITESETNTRQNHSRSFGILSNMPDGTGVACGVMGGSTNRFRLLLGNSLLERVRP